MLRGKIFEINEEIKVVGQICPPPGMNRVNPCRRIIQKNSF